MADKKLERIQLGSGGLTAGAQGLGCMGMSEFYGDTDVSAARATLEAAFERGVTMFDTADMYGRGENERFLGPFVRAHREQVVIATKVGSVRGAEGSMSVRNDPGYLRRAVDGSLSRLGLDVLDLCYLHRRDPSVPLADSIGAMAELVTQGKVRYLGLSEVTGDELREANAVHPIAAVQSEWSLFTRDIERTLVPAAAELGVGVVPYSPLGRGVLTGALPSRLPGNDVRAGFPRFTGGNAERNAELLAVVAEIAEARGASMAQIALAWLHRQAFVHDLAVVPIPGTRTPARLAENLAALEITLTAGELARLDPISGQVAGDRYPDMTETANSREFQPHTPKGSDMPSVHVAIAYYSGYGHTLELAKAVSDGVESVPGTRAELVDVADLTDAKWDTLDASDAIIFGTPTYMGSASGAFHAFAEATSKRWMSQRWLDKLASGFTNSGSMSGDKLHTLQYLALLAAQHGMHWVSLGLMPGWNTTTGSEHDDNRLGFYLGAGAQTWNDQGPDAVHAADLTTARHLGARVATQALRYQRPIAA
ncbi:aldo/keto reductase [Amycolatopsis sp. NPDC054798]